MDNKCKDYAGYTPPAQQWWSGRIDGKEQAYLRWHQWVQPLHLDELKTIKKNNAIVFLGFTCDEGVRRNKGRTGAAEAPLALRETCSNLPVFNFTKKMYDVGNIACVDGDLEDAQEQLACAVKKILLSRNFPILLGGGHEITYGHYKGISDFLGGKHKLGLVNFDAHFDLRSVEENKNNSGTGFWQIAQKCLTEGDTFNYLALGIQKTSNTSHLFDIATSLQVIYQLADDFSYSKRNRLIKTIERFIKENDFIYLTLDMDVFAAPFAPGVSALSYNGIHPDSVFFECLKLLIKSNKVVSLDIAETNPSLDIDKRTIKLAASILFEVVETLGN